MEKTYEIRIFRERFYFDEAYYESNEDIRISYTFYSVDNLIKKWMELVQIYEGETYSVWEHGDKSIMIIGGTYDPNDIDDLNNYFGTDYKFAYHTYEQKEEYTPWVAVKLKNVSDMEITEHLSMNGYTFDTNGNDIIFVFDEEMPYVETILEDNKIKYERV